MSIDCELRIEPLQMARRGQHLRGQMPINGMARLGHTLFDTSGQAEYSIKFDTDSAGQANITGSVKAELSLCCQRCMNKVLTKVESTLALGIISSHAEAELLSERYEPLVVEEAYFRFSDIIEDELLLALPLIVSHSDEDCVVSGGYSFDRSLDLSLGKESKEKHENRNFGELTSQKNPFSVLKKIKFG